MNELSLLSGIFAMTAANVRQDAEQILAFNELTAAHGLILSPQGALEVAETRARSLSENSRVEVTAGMGAVGRLMKTFAESAYAEPSNWAELLNSLADTFYFIKTETHDSISDVELTEFLFDEFEHYCGGSFELLAERADTLIRRFNHGEPLGHTEGNYDE